MIVVSVCLPPDALSELLPTYMGFLYVGGEVSPLGHHSWPWTWDSLLSWSLLQWALIRGPDIPRIAHESIGLDFHHQLHPRPGVVFALAPSLHSFWS